MYVTDRHDITLAVKVALNPIQPTNKQESGVNRLTGLFGVACLIQPEFTGKDAYD